MRYLPDFTKSLSSLNLPFSLHNLVLLIFSKKEHNYIDYNLRASGHLTDGCSRLSQQQSFTEINRLHPTLTESFVIVVREIYVYPGNTQLP